MASQVVLMVNNLPAHAGDVGLISGAGRSPGGWNGNGNPLQYPCPENPTDREAWRSAVHRFAKSWTWRKRLSTHASFWLLGESDKIICVETSLVAQWLGVHLPMQGTRAQFLVQEDPTCLWTTKLLRLNYWAQTLEPPHRNYWSRRLPSMRHKRSHRDENAHAPQIRPITAKKITIVLKIKHNGKMQKWSQIRKKKNPPWKAGDTGIKISHATRSGQPSPSALDALRHSKSPSATTKINTAT